MLSAQASFSNFSYVTIASYTGELAILDGGGTVDAMISANTSLACTIQGIQFQNSATSGNYGAIGLFTCQNMNNPFTAARGLRIP
jgi:hypothetical protein